MSQKVYPYQNISLENLEGEVWEDVPGLERYFLISNFGRIKRQKYELQHPNGYVYKLPEKILKPKLEKLQINLKMILLIMLWVRL